MLKLLIAIAASLCIMCSWADTVTVPNEFSADTTISSSKMNENFTALEEESNENDTRIDGAEASIDTLESYFPADSTATLSSGGWHTIAHLQCREVNGAECLGSYRQKGSAYFMVRWDSSGWHQTTVIYASSLFSKSSLKILHNQTFRAENKPFLAARLRTGSTYDGALLQIQVSSDASSSALSTSPFTARLMGRELEKESSDYGWIMTDWVADGAAIGSIDYSLLTDEIVKTIPDEVQYLADFSCTDGQLLEWNDSTDEWQCATEQELPDAVLRPHWVDANGVKIALATTPTGENPFFPNHMAYRFPESNRVFSYMYDFLDEIYRGGTVFFTGANCTGDAYSVVGGSLSTSYSGGAVTPGGNPATGKWMIPSSYAVITGMTDDDFQSRSELENSGAISCEGPFGIGNSPEFVNMTDTSTDVDLGIAPPTHIEWR